MKMNRKLTVLLALFISTSAMGEDMKEVTIKLTVPDAAWTIAIDEVHQVQNELWVISTVSRDPDRMAAQVISTVQDSVELVAPDLATKHFVIGKTWGWENKEPYTFIKDLEQLKKELKSGNLLYAKETNSK